jgi:hypothetical protein
MSSDSLRSTSASSQSGRKVGARKFVGLHPASSLKTSAAPSRQRMSRTQLRSYAGAYLPQYVKLCSSPNSGCTWAPGPRPPSFPQLLPHLNLATKVIIIRPPIDCDYLAELGEGLCKGGMYQRRGPCAIGASSSVAFTSCRLSTSELLPNGRKLEKMSKTPCLPPSKGS